ncbi:MAG: hypothetical protein IKA49_03310 [Alistipes sp.]|nr:hypothetical protein [Alistipes sp.]
MKKILSIVNLLLLATMVVGCASEPSFSVATLPAIDGVTTHYTAERESNEWEIEVKVKNTTANPVTVKVALRADAPFVAEHYLYPGINYNGNSYGDNLGYQQVYGQNNIDIPFPQGWEYKGEPWVFSYDRGSIPSCTISENDKEFFALFASDKDAASYVSSCSLERLDDGSFRHIIYWPITEAPLCYSDKKKFSERIDNYITLAPGEEFVATAFALQGEPKWKNYAFAEVFKMAWARLNHYVPSQWSVDEVLAFDKKFQDFSRCQDENGYWFEGIIDDMKFRAGYYGSGLSEEGYPVTYYEQNPERNHWWKDYVAESKTLRKGEYIKSYGRELGFAGQSFQAARLAMEYGFRNDKPEDIEWGEKLLHSWIEKRRYENGLFKSNRNRGHNNRDASNLGWAIGELSRVATLLNKNGRDGSEYEAVAKPIVEVVLKGVREDGAVGSVWSGETGEVVTYNGDGAGFMLMGLARYHALTGDERILPVIEKALHYYYAQDINHFRCFGGAMDCASIDKEGIQPFFTTAKYMYEQTADERYLEYARKAAYYFASWLYIHNPIYDADDDLMVFDIKPAGANIVGIEHSALDEYGALLIGEYLWLAKVDNEPLWREVAELIWRNGTQGFAYEGRNIWHGLERPIGSKGEAIFPSEWSKYASVGRKRGSVNNHLTAWGGIYRIASLYELSESDLQWLKERTKPKKR